MLAAATVLMLAGCSSTPTTVDSTTAGPSILAEYGLAGLDGREIVDRLDRTAVADRPTELRASVRPGELILSDVGSDDVTVVDLPDDAFYLSIAPYIDQTHDCYFHSLTTCRGQLAGTELRVTISQRDTGAVLVDEVTRTFDNGFVGFWLPSGTEATLDIEYDGYTASRDISTGPDAPTCLTTVQLVRSA